MKKKNEIKVTNIDIRQISMSKKGIGMYAITYKIGNKKYSETRHMRPEDVKSFIPTVTYLVVDKKYKAR